MVRDKDARIGGVQISPRPNPFDVVRERLAAVDLEYQDLHAQVH